LIRSFAMILAGLGVANSSLAVQTYLITDLGSLGGPTTTAAAINDNNQVVGASSTSSGFDAFLFSGGVMLDLGNLGGASAANALNSRGDVTGYSSGLSTGNTNHPFLFRNGALSDLGLPAGNNSGVATGVNGSDQVVGYFISGPFRRPFTQAFLWQSGVFNMLGTLNGVQNAYTSAAGINDSGQVAGTSVSTAGQLHAFVWQTGLFTDLGTLPGGVSSAAAAINSHGVVAGSSGTSNAASHAVIFQNGQVIDLGVPSGLTASTASAINNLGVAVGSASTGSYRGISRAVVSQNGAMTDLNRLIPGNSGSWILNSATGINDAGEIVGNGTTNGAHHAFLLTPTTEVTEPVAPIDLAGNSGNGVVSLTWVGSVGATSYNLKRSTSSSGPYSTIASLTVSNFTDTSVVDCTVYYYVVSAVNSAGESPNSANVAGVPQSVPAAPSNMTASPNTQQNLFLGSAISLAWRNNASSCSEFVVIERSTDGVNFQELASMGPTQNTYIDGFLNTGTRYFYRARAQSTGGVSGPSNTASAVAPPSPY